MHYADFKTILSPQNGMNVYRGCTHGCIYCDSRSHCYNMNHGFEDIEVKRNAPEILREQLQRKKHRCMISTGSMCDPYIPLEQELNMTRRCLKVIDEMAFGLTILTKSSLILRDLDLLTSINKKAKCVVQTTLTTFDEQLCKKIEPNVATTNQRYKMLKEMQKNNIPTVVWLCPILPFINDTRENLLGILDYCLDAKVRAIMFFGASFTMRAGSREYLYQCLDQKFPSVKQKYIQTFGEKYICYSPNNAQLSAEFREICVKNGIIHKPKDVFEYLKKFEAKEKQLSFFD